MAQFIVSYDDSDLNENKFGWGLQFHLKSDDNFGCQVNDNVNQSQILIKIMLF